MWFFSNDILLLKDIQNGPRSKSGSNGESWENLVTIQKKSIASLMLCYIQHLHSYQGQRSFHLCSILFVRFFGHVINIISVTSFNFSCHERYYHHNIIQTFLMLSLFQLYLNFSLWFQNWFKIRNMKTMGVRIRGIIYKQLILGHFFVNIW